MTAIELDGVTKRYGDIVAVDDLDIRVREGEIYGFLGPNGAGKSTTIDLLLDFARPSAGSARVLGYDTHHESNQVRKRIGVLPEGFDTYDRLTGRQHLAFAIESKGLNDDPETIAKRVGISNALDRKAGDYPEGMTQRLAFGMALVGSPEVLILDEPSTGLDPNGAHKMREIIRTEHDRGVTVFFSSHILGQIEAVCDRVGILRDGKLVAEDTVEGLRDATQMESILVIKVDQVSEGTLSAVHALSGVSKVTVENTSIRVTCLVDAKPRVFNTIEDEGALVQDFTTKDASLEDLFTAYTQDGQNTEIQA